MLVVYFLRCSFLFIIIIIIINSSVNITKKKNEKEESSLTCYFLHQTYVRKSHHQLEHLNIIFDDEGERRERRIYYIII